MLADGLERAAPRLKGVDAARIEAFLDAVETAGLELHNLMVWHRGAIVAEGWRWPYSPDRLRMSHSMTKSVAACAIGLLIDAGRLSLGDRVASFFPEVPVDPSSRHARMTIEHLITMRTGHAEEVSGSVWRGIPTSWVAEFFKIPVAHEPGTVFRYTSAASYMLSAIVTRCTGERIADYLAPRLFDPLGIEGWRWDEGPDGINPGGNGLWMRASDWVRFAVLHADGGRWAGRQVLPEDWVRQATRAHHGDEYGYHWVVTPTYYAALGQFVQFALVFPDSGGVVVLNGAMADSSLVRPFIEQHLAPAFRGAGTDGADASLAARLAQWPAPPEFTGTGPGSDARLNGCWRVSPNSAGVSAVSLGIAGDELRLALTDSTGVHRLRAPRDGWRETRTSLPGATLHHGYALDNAPVVSGFRWLGPDRIELVVHFVETAFRDTFVIARDRAGLRIDRSVNINSGDTAWPTLVGGEAL